jgi:hypothetical protein
VGLRGLRREEREKGKAKDREGKSREMKGVDE